MINRIELKEKCAREVLKLLAEHFYWRFTLWTDDMAVMHYNFYDQYGLEYYADIVIRASRKNDAILVYVNKKGFPAFYRHDYLDEEITEEVVSYIEQVKPGVVL